MVEVPVSRLPHGEGLPLPTYESDDAAGCDLRAAIPSNEPLILQVGERHLVPTGISIALPRGFEAQVRPRSGLAVHHGVTILNAPGTVDADYRGEIKAILINLGDRPFSIQRGDRIAQLVVAPVLKADFREVATHEPTARGDAGFGSTGT